jgi:hypothetical protein
MGRARICSMPGTGEPLASLAVGGATLLHVATL